MLIVCPAWCLVVFSFSYINRISILIHTKKIVKLINMLLRKPGKRLLFDKYICD